MTPAEKAGIKVGDKCVVIDVSDEQHTFKTGETIYLVYDDGTIQPRFSSTPDDDNLFSCDYIYLRNVKIVEEKKPTPAQRAGLNTGDKVVMIKDVGEGGCYFKEGEEAILVDDDGDEAPAFKYLKREHGQEEDYDSPYWYVDIFNVKKVEEKKAPQFDVATQEISYDVTILTFKRLLTQDELDKIAEILEK